MGGQVVAAFDHTLHTRHVDAQARLPIALVALQDDDALVGFDAVGADDAFQHGAQIFLRALALLVHLLDGDGRRLGHLFLAGVQLGCQVQADQLLCRCRQAVLRPRTEIGTKLLDVEAGEVGVAIEHPTFQLVTALHGFEPNDRHGAESARLVLHIEVQGGLVAARVCVDANLTGDRRGDVAAASLVQVRVEGAALHLLETATFGCLPFIALGFATAFAVADHLRAILGGAGTVAALFATVGTLGARLILGHMFLLVRIL